MLSLFRNSLTSEEDSHSASNMCSTVRLWGCLKNEAKSFTCFLLDKKNNSLIFVKKHIGKWMLGICLIFILSTATFSQNTLEPKSAEGVTNTSPDTSKIKLLKEPNEIRSPPNDIAFSTEPSGNRESNIKDAVAFQSTDSLIVDLKNGRKATLYGTAKVSHTVAALTSGTIAMNLETNIVEASTQNTQDTLSMPVLKRESEEIKSRRILFNYKTQKGKFEEAHIKVGEGQLIGAKVKNINEKEVFIEDGMYSTCPPEYLYYYLKAKRMKVVDEDEIFFSNARLYILDIPYPFVFPFGYVPSGIKQKQSGLLTPTYVFDATSTRGIGLTNVGWFQYINDFITTSIKGDIYTSGTLFLTTNTQYRNSDIYNGSLNLGYSRTQGLEPSDSNFNQTINKSISIQHNQKISPYSNINANVNLRTAEYYTENSFDIDQRAETSSQSRIAYKYKHPENLYTFSTDASLNQDFSTHSTILIGPNSSFTLKSISPFQNNSRNTGERKWYESLNIQYNNKLKTDFSYRPIDADSAEISFFEALTSPTLFEEATGNDDYIRAGLQQTASFGFSGLIPSQFINTSASIKYNEYWFPSSVRKSLNRQTNDIETKKISGFVTGRDFTTSLNFSTTMYGLRNTKIGKLEGFRHTFTPTIGFSYRPDFSDDQWGFYRTIDRDTLGNELTYSIFEDEIFNGPGRGESRSLNVAIRNVFETKIVNRDSTGEVKEKKLTLIDDLSLRTSYNFAADSLNLSDLSVSLTSKAFDGLNLRANANFSFYRRDDNGNRFNRFLLEDGKFAQMERFTLTASTNFKGGRKGIEPFTPIYKKKYDPFNQRIFSAIDPGFGYEPVAPLNSPWSFGLNFSYTWNYRFNAKPLRKATINVSNISFNLTPKWRFNTRLGYDLIEKELTPSQFNLNRNLECWDLSFTISPFGENQYYFFKLSVNSSQIQNLFQKLPVLRNLERGSSKTGRTPNGFSRFN